MRRGLGHGNQLESDHMRQGRVCPKPKLSPRVGYRSLPPLPKEDRGFFPTLPRIAQR